MGKDIEGMEPRNPSDGKSTDEFLGNDDQTDADASDPGIVELGDGTLKRRMTVYLDPDAGKKVKVLAAIENRKISDVLADAVEDYLDGRELPDF